MSKRKPKWLTVTVTEFGDDYESEIFQMDYDIEQGETVQEACARALRISAHGCSDED